MTSVDVNEISQLLGRGVDLTARRDYVSALPIFTAVYQAVETDKFPQGLSAYGLCLSQVQHKNKAGADLCEKAIALQPYEGSHWANLVRLYVGVKNRKKAVEVREEIGYRQAPSLIFLPRAHPLNKFFSRTASAWTKNGRTILYVAAGLLVAGIAASVIYLLMQ